MSPILNTLAAAVLVFAGMTLAASHGRYRAWVLRARQRMEEGGVEPEDAAILVTDTAAASPRALLWLGSGENLHSLRSDLAGILRKRDMIVPLRGGALLLLLYTASENLPAIVRRLRRWFVERGRGTVSFRELSTCEELLHSPPGREVDESAPLPRLIESSPYQDPLTGVLHPERTPVAFRRHLAGHRRRNRPLCLLRVDVDGMEEINRLRGREDGDAVLRGVAAQLMRDCRETDLIGRLADDEFLICMPGTPEQMVEVARRMAASLRQHEIALPTGSLRVTVCIGVAGAPAHGQSPGALFVAAGQALAEARSRGRGICMVWSPSMHPAATLDETVPHGSDRF